MNNWTAWVGVKFGTLTVEKYLGYQDRGSAYFLVRCWQNKKSDHLGV